MLRPPIERALAEIAALMSGAAGDWWVIGSAAVALHGADTTVADVDVLLGAEDATRLLPAHGIAIARPRADDRFRSDLFACTFIEGVPIEFMAGLRVREAGDWTPIAPATRCLVRSGEAMVPVPERAELASILRRFGRPKDHVRAVLLAAPLSRRATPP